METKKRALGKGLEQLFNTENLDLDSFEQSVYETATKEEIIEVNIDELRVNPYQPRKNFDKDALNELANSIKVHGIIQPLVVNKQLDGKYMIISGIGIPASSIITNKAHLIRRINQEIPYRFIRF